MNKNITKLNDTLKNYLHSISEYTTLSQEEEIALSKRIMEGDIDAKDTFIRCNLKLVVSIAKQYARYHMPFMDLIQEGNLGMIRAVDKFDYTLGYKFSTYATQWIRQYIARYIMDKSNLIHVPLHILEDEIKLRKQIDLQAKQLQRIPTLDEIIQNSNFPKEKVIDLLNMVQDPISIDMQIDAESDTSLKDILEDDTIITPNKNADQQFIKEHIENSLHILSSRERDIIRKRFGLHGCKTMTLEEIGNIYGITRERVRQIESKAMRKLKSPKIRKNLEDYYHDLE